jgi:16S rRNA (guanine966-N2)-methyltransferase
LPVADVDGLRPTSERIRETLFNWLAPVIDGAHCLDLFAGSGALGFEALSRGAASAVFVERARSAARLLRQNMETLECVGGQVIEADAFDWLRKPDNHRFDIVFLDPPFDTGGYEELCRLLSEGRWLADRALVYIEQRLDQPAPALPAGWQTKKEKTAGSVRYSLVEAMNKGSSQ